MYNRHNPAPMAASLTLLRLAGLVVIGVLLLGACSTARDSELFHVVNGTPDTVTVKMEARCPPIFHIRPWRGDQPGYPCTAML